MGQSVGQSVAYLKHWLALAKKKTWLAERARFEIPIQTIEINVISQSKFQVLAALLFLLIY